MQSDETKAPISMKMLWTGWILGLLPALLMVASAAMKFIQPLGFAEGLEHLGWTESQIFNIGILELVCVVIYLIPRTAVLGAILLTGYLGGATATHIRVGDQFFGPVVIGVMFWLGLFLRDQRLHGILPFRR